MVPVGHKKKLRIYVNFAAAQPADRWIEGLAPGGRLIFPLGVPGPRQPNLGGRHSDRGAVLRIERRSEGICRACHHTGLFCLCGRGSLELPADEWRDCGRLSKAEELMMFAAWSGSVRIIRALLVCERDLGSVSGRYPLDFNIPDNGLLRHENGMPPKRGLF
jgi:hypothetical protein